MGSRWRQMLMDYGQVLGNEKSSSGSNSAFFTLDGDLSQKKTEDMQLRSTLELHFRPLFQRYVYGGEKIACHDLRRLLRDPEYRDRLPPDKVHELADLADFNMGRAIKYDEFVRIVMGKPDDQTSFGSDSGEDKTFMKPETGVMNVVCRNTVPQILLDDHLGKYRWLPPPFFMITITIIQIIVFIVYTQEFNGDILPLRDLPVDNNVIYIPDRRRECWRFITYCFLHQGYIDLIFNVLLQVILGFPLEVVFSWWRMAIVYFLGVLAGSLSHSVLDRYTYLAGAAGGSYAIMMGHLFAMWQNRGRLNDNQAEKKWIRFVCSLGLRAFFILLVVIPQLALAVYRRWFYDGTDDGREVGIAAHCGGIVAGFILSQAFLKDHLRYPWQEGAGWMNLFCFLMLIGGSIIFNIAFHDYPPEDHSDNIPWVP